MKKGKRAVISVLFLFTLTMFPSFTLAKNGNNNDNGSWRRESFQERLRIKLGYFTGVARRYKSPYTYEYNYYPYYDYHRHHNGLFDGGDVSYGLEYVIPHSYTREIVLSLLYVPGNDRGLFGWGSDRYNYEGWYYWPHHLYPFPENSRGWVNYDFRYWQAGLNFFSYGKSNSKQGRMYAGAGIALSNRDDDIWGFCETEDGGYCPGWEINDVQTKEIVLYDGYWYDDYYYHERRGRWFGNDSDVDVNLFLGWESYNGFHIQGQYIPDEDFGIIFLGYDFYSRAAQEKAYNNGNGRKRSYSNSQEKTIQTRETIEEKPKTKDQELTFASGSDDGLEPGDILILYAGDEVVGTGEVTSVEKNKCKVKIKSLSEGISTDKIDGALKQ